MNIGDKLGCMDQMVKTSSWTITRDEHGAFQILLFLKLPVGAVGQCSFKTNWHAILSNAIDEAIDLYKTDTSHCTLC